jgi:large subunit ribosomal protein L13
MMAKHPTAMVEMAIRGMLPKNRLGREVFRNLYVYAGTNHEQIAQQPSVYTLKG